MVKEGCGYGEIDEEGKRRRGRNGVGGRWRAKATSRFNFVD